MVPPRQLFSIVIVLAVAVAATFTAVPATKANEGERSASSTITAADRTTAQRTERQIGELLTKGFSPEKIAEETGLELVSTPAEGADDAVAPLSDGSDVTVKLPTVYYDNANDSYSVTARFEWDDQLAFELDCGSYYGDCGGPDALAISVSQSVSSLSSSSSFCDQYGENCTSGWLSTSNSYGIGRAFQDAQVRFHRNRGVEGWAMFSFRPLSSGTCHQFFSKLAHTWDDTGVSGVSIGASSIGFSWSNQSHQWEAASPTASLWCP